MRLFRTMVSRAILASSAAFPIRKRLTLQTQIPVNQHRELRILRNHYILTRIQRHGSVRRPIVRTCRYLVPAHAQLLPNREPRRRNRNRQLRSVSFSRPLIDSCYRRPSPFTCNYSNAVFS